MLPNPDQDTFQVEWWLDGKLISTSPTRETSDGFAYICTVCDHVMWAAKYFPNRAMTRLFMNCPRHIEDQRPGEILGSLIRWWHDEMDAMPEALIVREYEVHLAYYERVTNERDTLERQAA